MIQELFGGATNINNNNSSFIEGERKISSFNQQVTALQQSPPTPLVSSSAPIITTSTTVTTSENQNLRCPRCDSSNTKFCYYNNYNLTQPRHFCKTCRRYWTKGGALRNVPIGGGCRKNRNSSGIPNPIAKASSSKMKGVASTELGRSTTLGPLLDDHELQLPPTLPILWGSPQNTNFLAFLRANQNQNQNPNPSPSSSSSSTPMSSSIVSHVKELFEEGKQQSRSSSSSQYNMVSTDHHQRPLLSSNGLVLSTINPRISYDGVGQVPFWRNNNHQDQIQQQNIGFVLGGEQYYHHQSSSSSSSGTGIQELYQKLRSTSSPNYCSSSTNNYNSTIIQGNMASSLSNIFDSSSSDQFGCWNPTLSWSDNLPTTNAASYPS